MRVLYISGMYPTPAYPQKGIFCHEQVKALRRIGVDVDVVVPLPFYNREVRQDTWTYEGIEIRYVRYFKLPGTADYHRTGKALYHALDRAIDLRNYDIYHADAPLPAGQAAMIAGKKYNKPFVVHGHGLDVFMDTDYHDKRNCDRIADTAAEIYRQSNAIVGVSKKVINRITDRIDIADKCYVVYNGVNTERFYPGDIEDIHVPLRIISVGNLIELKGHELLIKAVSNIIIKGTASIQLDIYGSGEKEKHLSDLVKQLDLTEIVRFKGYIHNDRLADVYRKYDVFILPSWYEALGCVYLEAMASGLITVGCTDNGIDEIINNGENGYLVSPHSVEDLENVIDVILKEDRSTLSRLRTNAVKCVNDEYTWIESAKKLQGIYEKVCKGLR